MKLPRANAAVDDLLDTLQAHIALIDLVNIEAKSHSEEWFSKWFERAGRLIDLARAIRNRMNAARPINRIPVELLGNIFLRMQDEYVNTSFYLPLEDPKADSTNSWMTVTRVCQQWRNSACNDKALWCRIVVGPRLKNPTAFAMNSLTLSNPLAVELEYSSRRQTGELFSYLVQHPSRIAALYLYGKLPKEGQRLLKMPLANLHSLNLFQDYDRDDEEALAARTVDEKFLAGQTSNLRRLALRDFIWSPSASLSSLTTLFLVQEHGEPLLTYQNFLDILRSLSTTLQVLYLEGGPPYMSDEAVSSLIILSLENLIVMPYLRHVEIQPFEDAAWLYPLIFLHDILIPPDAKVVWSYVFSDGDRPEHLTWATIPPARHLEHVINLVGSNPESDCFVLNDKSLYFDPDVVPLEELDELFASLPNIRLLAAHGSELTWLLSPHCRLAGSLTSLHLEFEGLDDDDFVDLLTGLDKGHEITDLYVPHLEELVIHRFGPNYLPHPHEIDSLSLLLEEEGVTALKLSPNHSMFRTRAQLQAETYTLSFVAASFDEFFNKELLDGS